MKKVFFILFFVSWMQLSAVSTLAYNSQIEAVIFDCDGVLVDTEYLKFQAWQEALASESISFDIGEYMPLVGHTSKHILQQIRQLKGIEISDSIIALKDAKYEVLQKQGVSPIKEMVLFAKCLAEAKHQLGIKLGLASSAATKEIMENLMQIGLDTCFDLIISGSQDLKDYVDKEGKNKPKPYIYIEAAKRLGVSPSKCLVFEDTTAGIEAAFSAGMIAIAVPNQFTQRQDFSKAADIIHSYEEILELFYNLRDKLLDDRKVSAD